MTITKTVYNYLDSLQDGTIISGWHLFDVINAKTHKHTYPSTLLKMCRNYCQIVGGEFECIDTKKSKYRFHKGAITLDNMSINGKE